jgi:RNA polymerase sigma-54 factor
MKQSIQLRLGQQLTMTPQLQQAIRLLQLSTLELQTEIQNALDSNPMLEQGEAEAETPEAHGPGEIERTRETVAEETDASLGNDRTDTIPDDLPVDSNWDDIFDTGATSYSAPGADDRRDTYESISASRGDLHDHLYWQLDMTNLSEADRVIATTLIDAIDEDGYLTQDLAEIQRNLALEMEIEPAEVEAVLHCIQQFDPVGVGARHLGECLSLQLAQFEPGTPWLKEAGLLIREHLNLLGNHDYNTLIRRMRLAKDDLQHVIHLIQSLNPRPGSQFSATEPEYIIPDVYVRRHEGNWQVELNAESIPKLRINSLYANMVKRANNSKDNTYLKNNLQEARWFLKSLQSRHETLLKVANCIVVRQRAFFEYGDEAMKPMVLRSIADEVSMHESTISRVTTRKYMHTPRGIYEFKYFFSSHVSTEAGGECSATAIRAIIKKLVAAENPARPLSDSKMASLLAEQGIQVARRTIAKYRESLSIAPSNERKRLT